MDFNGLIRSLKKGNVIIYGTGYVATCFYRSMKERNLAEYIVCFVTTTGSDQMIDNLSVKSIDEIEKDDSFLFCVAVHESIKDEIISTLKEKGFKNYIWIYPYQYAMMLGNPVKLKYETPVRTLLEKGARDFGMAVRYLAIEEYYGKNAVGFEIYKKFMSLHCSENTAEKRVDNFKQLIYKWDKDGYDEKQTIGVMEDGQIIDGRHRLALACYYGQQVVVCDVYPASKKLEEIHSKETLLMEENFSLCDFTDEIIKQIKDASNRMLTKYNIEKVTK